MEEEKEIEVTINNKKYRITKKKIESAFLNKKPQRIMKYWISLNKNDFPIKQAISLTLGISPMLFGTSTAYKILNDLEFKIFEK